MSPSAPFSFVRIAVASLAVLTACRASGDEAAAESHAAVAQPPPADAPSDPDPSAKPDPRTDHATDAAANVGKLLAWLDPNAVAAAAIALPPQVDPAALVSVFGVPPRGEKLLEAAAEVDRWLPEFVADDAPPSGWLGQPALAMVSAFSTGPTVIRPMTKPKAEVAAILAAGGFDKQVLEGMDVFHPRKSFPYRVALLDEHVLAFIPAREPGTGLSPLTAGRDLPASDLERQLAQAFTDNPNLYVELYAAGPMMHFDLDPPLVGARFELLPWRGGGLEGRVLLQPSRDAAAAVAALEQRAPVGENDRVVQMAKAVAYQLDGEFVVGVLQLPAADVTALGTTP